MPWLFALLSCAIDDPPTPAPVTHVVRKGDTLFVIARDYGVELAALKQANELDGDLIEVGQRLRIPEGALPSADPSPRPRRPRAAGAPTPATAPNRPALTLPPAKACLAGPQADALQGDHAAAASVGLDQAQVRTAMDAFLPQVQPCLAALDTPPTGALTLSITVGCDGRVAKVRTQGQDDWPEAPARCIVDTLAFAPFPAHDLPDGDTFVYPLRMR